MYAPETGGVIEEDWMSREPLLTVEEVAAWLAVTPETLRGMVRRGEIPHLRSGQKLIRFDREQLQQWADQHSGGTQDGKGPRVP
ncbi:DNA-binding protein [Aeromicrobium camelliae]|uniref:DNA-binding protein n=1 Tax=Aeromicrobium camelliae TaxID=1538144 RepID=A0A3N6WL39_9ACTN|nr:helix-turn-helix domain-containing protein [Aeromicrobium camelliae]RQN02033.1 DNA-binding protein [Aeromicrobium camelliae]